MRIRILVLMMGVMYAMSASAQDGDAILGLWQSEYGDGRIQIYKTGDVYAGKIIWLKENLDEFGEPKTDHNNPSGILRQQPLKGLEVLSDFSYKGNHVWEDGMVYDPRSGKWYSCILSMSSSDQLEMRAYKWISLFGKSQYWSRVK
jgi:uncharacterized protein (DUF2147 family)